MSIEHGVGNRHRNEGSDASTPRLPAPSDVRWKRDRLAALFEREAVFTLKMVYRATGEKPLAAVISVAHFAST
ncbi:hypothetical protein U9797_25245, partial [Escherichia coli]